MSLTIHATLEYEKLKLLYSDEEILRFLSSGSYYTTETKAEWKNHIRNMLEGWEKISSVEDYKPKDHGPNVPGTYALVYNGNGKVDHPILWNRAFMFGETTQPGWKRLIHHVGALRGKSSNMSDKYRKHLPVINESCGVDIKTNLSKVDIYFRPHRVSDPDHETYDRHSQCMEQQAHAFFWAIWNTKTSGNTRDLPQDWLITKCKEFLTEKGIPTKY